MLILSIICSFFDAGNSSSLL